MLVLLFSFSSCKMKQETRKEIKEVVKDDMGVDIIFSRMKEKQFDFRTMNAKFSASFSKEKKTTNFSGSLRIVKDRCIWVSISAVMGIEAFRVIVDSDSVKMINRLDKSYFVGNYELLNKLFNTPFDFDMLQAVLTGNDFNYYENNVFKVAEDALNYRISTVGRKKLKNYVANQSDVDRILIQDVWIDPSTYRILCQQLKEIKNEKCKLLIDYSEFIAVNDEMFPSVCSMKVEADNKVGLDITYQKVTVDEEITMPFNIPASYKLME